MVYNLIVPDEEYEQWVMFPDGYQRMGARFITRIMELSQSPEIPAPLLKFLSCRAPLCGGVGEIKGLTPGVWGSVTLGYSAALVCRECTTTFGNGYIFPTPEARAWPKSIGACPLCPPNTLRTINYATKEVTCARCDHTTDDGVRWWRK